MARANSNSNTKAKHGNPQAKRVNVKPRRTRARAGRGAKVEPPKSDPKCDAKAVHSLLTAVETLIANAPQHTHTVYDILRCPGYKTWAQQADNIEGLQLALDSSTCSCKRRRVRVKKIVEEAWNRIKTPNAKENHDGFTGEKGYASPFTCEGVPIHCKAQSIIEKLKLDDYPCYALDSVIRDVVGTSVVWVPDRPAGSLFCRKRQNTFWTSLSQGLIGDTESWAKVKVATNDYYQTATLEPNCHPRRYLYEDLHAATLLRRSSLHSAPHIPIGTPAQQLLPDGTYLNLWDVTPELWQVVADCFRIELIIIYNYQSPSSTSNSRKHVITRGSHNAQQIFMLLESDGEYVPLRPMVPDRANWRYTSHMPKPGRSFEDSTEKSGRIRSPCVRFDSRALPVEPIEGIQKLRPPTTKGEQVGICRYEEPWWVPQMLAGDFWGSEVDNERVKNYLATGEWC